MEISDPVFREAVYAIDTGDVPKLEQLIRDNPRLIHDRLDTPTEGYFSRPYLLWFVAENPTRNEKLPKNIVAIARTIIAEAERAKDDNLNYQIDYTLGLVSSGRVPRDCGVQLALIDLLVEQGADPNHAMQAALIHEETAAVERLVHHGATITLPAAISLGKQEAIKTLLPQASGAERQIALAVAALYGQAETIALLLTLGVDVNKFAPASYHGHATPLHHAILSGSLDAVKVLVKAGASLHTRDKIYDGLPLGWAVHSKHENVISYIREGMAAEMADALIAAGIIPADQRQKAVDVIKPKISN